MSRISLNSIKSEKVLITGASGLLGRQLIYELLKRGIRPICLVRKESETQYIDTHDLEKRYADLVQEDSLREALVGIDRVIHTAALVNFRGDQRTRFARINAFAAERCYQFAVEAGVKRFVQVSSIVGVGAAVKGGAPIHETAEFALAGIQVPYIESKRQAEELLLGAVQPETELIILNPSIMVAPSRRSSDKMRIDRLMSRAFIPRIPNKLNLVDIRDASEGIVNALVAGESGKRYLLTGENLSVDQLFDHLERLSGKSPRRMQPPLWIVRLLAQYQLSRQKRRGGKLRIYPELLKMLEFDWIYENTRAKRDLAFTTRPIAKTLQDLYSGEFSGTFMDSKI